MLGTEGISAGALNREVGIAQSTLSKWARDARKLSSMNNKNKPNHPKSPRQWTAEEKLNVVQEAASISNEDLGAFLRSKGLHEAQLKEWLALAKEALAAPKKKKSGKKNTSETKKIKQLERELRRKEKALAEMAALITLQKKMKEIWGDEDDDTPTRSGT
jgi:transposase-like protein